MIAALLGFFGIFGLLFGLVGFCLVVLATIFWIWMIIDCVTNRYLGSGEKIAWTLVIILLHGLGALIYFIAGRKQSY